MRFMVLVRATPDTEAGALPTETMLEAMGRYMRELAQAGVLLEGSGLQPSSKGARIRFSEHKTTTVTDGPFAESKELVAGYHVIEVKSKEEAIAWTRRMPNPTGTEGEVEIRQLYELDDFGPRDEIARHFPDALGR